MKKWIVIASFLLPSLGYADTHYVCGTATNCNSNSSGWSNGADSGAGTSKSAPWATLTYAMANTSGGDTVLVGTDVYTARLDSIPAGSAGAYTTIQAEILHGPEIRYGTNGNQAVLIASTSYVVFDGFKVNGNGTGGDSGTGGAVLMVANANHVKVLRNAIWGAANTDQSWVLDVNASDTCLVEGNWAWGMGRYKIGATASNNIIFRRNVARHDYAMTSIQCAPFINYDAYNTIWQNNISVDSDPNNQYCNGHMYGAWYFENKNDRTDGVHSTKNTLYGNISIQNGNSTYGAGWYARMSGGPWAIDNMIIYNQKAGLLFEHGAGDAASASINHATIGHITGTGYDQNNGEAGVGVAVNQIQGDQGYVTNTPLTNSILFDAYSYGIGYSLASDYNVFYANGSNTASSAIGAHSITATNPLTNGLLYLPRIEAGSYLKTAGESGTQIGAEVMYQMGAPGTLYGEAGWNLLQDGTNGQQTLPLWPWTNEDLIKADMATYSGLGPSGARGFATGTSMDGQPQSLTKYIWEQLGNQIPADIYGGGTSNGSASLTGQGGGAGVGTISAVGLGLAAVTLTGMGAAAAQGGINALGLAASGSYQYVNIQMQ